MKHYDTIFFVGENEKICSCLRMLYDNEAYPITIDIGPNYESWSKDGVTIYMKEKAMIQLCNDFIAIKDAYYRGKK